VAGLARIARVMVDTPLPQLDRLFDYRVPESMAADARPGVRVRVPLRSLRRIADGFIVEVVTEAEFTGALSELEAVVSAAPVLAPEVWTVARRVADRAAGSASDVIRLAVPKRQVRVEKAWLATGGATGGTASARADDGPGEVAGEAGAPAAETPAAAPVDTGSEAAVGAAHESAGDPEQERDPVVPPEYDAPGFASAITSRLRLAVDAVPRVARLADGTWVGHWAVTMAAAAALALQTGGSAILAVPDYRDQEQLLAALSEVLPADRVVHLDARQSGPDRYRAHLACLGDEPLVVVGNRSVVYAPAARLALIAVWDDGDPLHAEPLGPYVHVRDAALVRQELQSSALWFVGHSRSTEVERLAELGFLGRLSPARRITPKVVPTAQQAPQDRYAAIARIPSSAWRTAREALETGPVLVQVARPGYAPTLSCTECGHAARCLRCDGPLAQATAGAIPSCRWCGLPATDWHCTNCDGTAMRMLGQGSVRTADELGRAFPGIRVILSDGTHLVQTVDDRPALVVATRGAEPIAAGGYRAVLLLDGERMLARESLRVGEDCLRTWSNAAALGAVGAPVVLVGVGGQLASAMATWRPEAYASAELVDRRRLRFPPAVRLATVTGEPDAVAEAASEAGALDGADVLGPVEHAAGVTRAIVRFDYAHGALVAATLRAAVVRAATRRRKRVAGAANRPALPTLRVRFDDPEPFVE
jgi:primosomal protein N' (replication factor Y)